MQQDDLRGITLLNLLAQLNVCQVGPPPKLRCQRETFPSMPAKRLIAGHRLHHDEFGAMTLTERERVLEGTTRGLREVDRYEDARALLHDAASRLGSEMSSALPTVLGARKGPWAAPSDRGATPVSSARYGFLVGFGCLAQRWHAFQCEMQPSI